ncbi:hypothetical protein CI710_05350 [Aeromonas salmonicida]|nr:hypothetical protein CI710_05350 [Aeromonas salmonicida]
MLWSLPITVSLYSYPFFYLYNQVDLAYCIGATILPRAGCCPLLFAEVSPFVQAARQDAERAPLGHGWPIGACRGTNGLTEGTRRRRANKWGIRLLVTLGLSKVTRQAAQRRRNPVEGSALVSCMA